MKKLLGHNGKVTPDSLRLSEHFLLSDFMGCNSVYAKGYANVFPEDVGRLREGRTLAEKVLEPLLEYSKLSITYGFISPELSKLIVKYQDPSKPSYHRWDSGAACDVILHDRIATEPPIASAFWMDENLPVSRVITYSESPCICVASRAEEIAKGDPRRALYENRYVGVRKPQYINYSSAPATRRRQKQEMELEHPWEGNGFPSYHGGGILQAQHIRTSKYTVLSDFLYSDRAVMEGYANPYDNHIEPFEQAGTLYDDLIEELGIKRLSIVRGYESPTWASGKHNWKKEICLIVVPPSSTEPSDVCDAALSLLMVTQAKVISGTNRVGIVCQLP